MTLKLGELCAGFGGLGLAVENIFNAELIWYSEFDPSPSKVMAEHWPGIPNYGDMTKIDWSTVPHVDVLSGGTPCQDLSHAGRRAGMTEGTRSNLWVAMREAIATIKPTYVVWENVRGAYSAKADSHVEQCAGCMGEVGGQVSMLCGHLDVYSATFPTSGMTRNGVAYELPTWEHRMQDSEFSSLQPDGLLRTPTASEVSGGMMDPAKAKREGRTVRLASQIVDLANPGQLLPTPMANEGEKAYFAKRESPGQKYLSHVLGEQDPGHVAGGGSALANTHDDRLQRIIPRRPTPKKPKPTSHRPDSR